MIIEQRNLERGGAVIRRIDTEDAESEPISGVYVVFPDGSEVQLETTSDGSLEIRGTTIKTSQLAVKPRAANTIYVSPGR